jgi:hypothetical protein
VKIVIGIDESGLPGSPEIAFAAIDEANRSGAVSPATRAIARIVEVTIPPTAVGRVACMTVYDVLAPSARLASRVVAAVRVSTSSVPRAM